MATEGVTQVQAGSSAPGQTAGPHWLQGIKVRPLEKSLAIQGRVFVVGTGRSGTTRLAQVLGTHPQVFAWPFETRFLVDPDGLRDLVYFLHESHDYFRANAAVHRFEELMLQSIHRPMTSVVEESWYCAHVRQFVSQLVQTTFDEAVGERVFVRYVCRYFADRGELIGLIREFVDELFSRPALAAGKTFWCEKTPLTMLALPFLWEVFPEARVVHIKRDPRGVAESLLRQPWAPETLPGVLDFLEPIYRRWAQIKTQCPVDQDPRYQEVALEDLAADPQRRLNELCQWLGLPAAQWQGSFDPRRVHGWQERLSPQQIRLCEQRLRPYFELMGYPI